VAGDAVAGAGARAAVAALPRRPEAAGEAPGSSFGELVKGLVSEVNQSQSRAEASASALARGEAGIVETVLALNDADLKLRLAVEVRNRFLAAWQEISTAGR